MTRCNNCGGPCEVREQLLVTDQPLVLHGNFCVHCCIRFGWASSNLLSPDPDEYDPDDDDLD